MPEVNLVTQRRSLKEFYILGVKINEITLSETVDFIEGRVASRQKSYVVLTGAHGIVEMQSDDLLLSINNHAHLVTPDGMPVVWIGRLKGFSNIEKVYAPEIMEEVFRIGPDRKHKHFLYGGEAGVADRLAAILREKYSGIEIVGTYSPPFRPLTEVEKRSVVNQVNESNADIVWCGLGCPKQEKWMHEFRSLLEAPVLIGVGAGFDFLSGRRPIAPYWITRSGFEWLYRLLSEPKRLFKRYLRVVPQFVCLVILEFLGAYRKSAP